MTEYIRLIGLIVALLYLIFNVDDFIWEIICTFKKRRVASLLPEDLEEVPPKLLAVLVAAWQEDNVLEDVIDHLQAAILYPQSMYYLFLGVYPNDQATIEVVQRLAEKYENVHLVFNQKPGPTSKADNLNNVINYVQQFEIERGWSFQAIIVHDSEDVVHPYEFKVANYLLEKHQALQFPVFPLQEMPSWGNFGRNLTKGTYADEFAENHFRIMTTRNLMGAVVPSAGTGLVLARSIWEEAVTLFPDDVLTEDYKLSLSLAKQGIPIYYVLEKVKRLVADGQEKREYIAVRSIFPDTWQRAVRQKTRWIYGITMQSVKLAHVFEFNKLNWAGRYTLYRDWKAKFVNLLLLPGYLLLIYLLMSWFYPLPRLCPRGTFFWWLCLALVGLMLFNQFRRAYALVNVYGIRSMVFACLVPPFLPVRFLWGNVINFSATLAAWWKLFAFSCPLGSKKPAWKKTEHEFLEKEVLDHYHRKLGDILLKKGYLEKEVLSQALKEAQKAGCNLSTILWMKKLITEEQLMSARADLRCRPFVKNITFFINDLAHEFEASWLEAGGVYPLFKTRQGYVFAETYFLVGNPYGKMGIKAEQVERVYTTMEKILQAIYGEKQSSLWSEAQSLLLQGKISGEQAVLAVDYQTFTPDILGYMGLRKECISRQSCRK